MFARLGVSPAVLIAKSRQVTGRVRVRQINDDEGRGADAPGPLGSMAWHVMTGAGSTRVVVPGCALDGGAQRLQYEAR
jgi:hypothetical protein